MALTLIVLDTDVWSFLFTLKYKTVRNADMIVGYGMAGRVAR